MTKCYLGRNSGHIDSFCIRLWCLHSNSDLQFSLSSMQLHVWKNTYGFFTRQGVSLSWKNNDQEHNKSCFMNMIGLLFARGRSEFLYLNENSCQFFRSLSHVAFSAPAGQVTQQHK